MLVKLCWGLLTPLCVAFLLLYLKLYADACVLGYGTFGGPGFYGPDHASEIGRLALGSLYGAR